jgi:hypothetical protein
MMGKEQRLFPHLGFRNYDNADEKKAFFNTRDYALAGIEYVADLWAEYSQDEKDRRTDLFVEIASSYKREHHHGLFST